MAVFKCKMCGGTLELTDKQSVAICEYCGTQQTLPKLDDDRKANLYDRANHFRRNNEFDKAMGIYEQILNEDTTDAESYWSLVLCRYGIEYVEDPSSHKRVPTVNRAQFTSIFDDEDYKSALQYADGFQREIYESEAAAINEIQKGILAISQKEEPFDVFICYKETDSNGRRTPDSVLATELYHELSRDGFKVFFSRITLEDKLGQEYEPYIFAALNSAKVMVVLGTKVEHFNAVWVKNEWSRYLSLIKNGARKVLIPAYKDVDPYDLPEEFSHLQAQDMSRLGFMQDLTRGIKKFVESNTEKQVVHETVITNEVNNNVTALLKRGYMALEDGEWAKADAFFEQCLNQNAELAEAYLGKLMVELQVRLQSELSSCAEPFDANKNYQKAVRFADPSLAKALKQYSESINNRKAKEAEERYKDSLYLRATEEAKTYDIAKLNDAIQLFTEISDWKDSSERIRLCQARIDQIHIREEKEKIEAERKAEERRIAAEQARLEKLRYDEKRKIEIQNRIRKVKKLLFVIVPLLVVVVILAAVYNLVIIPNNHYNNAIVLMEQGKFEEAVAAFEALDGYKDSENKIEECKVSIADQKYSNAIRLLELDKHDEAIHLFADLGEYKDAAEQIIKAYIAKGEYLLKNQDYQGAITAFEKADASDRISEAYYYEGEKLLNEKNYMGAISKFTSAGEYKDAAEKVLETHYIHAEAMLQEKDYAAAMEFFRLAGSYKDAQQQRDSLYNNWQLPNENLRKKNASTIAAGGFHVVGLKTDGSVVSTGGSSLYGEGNVSGWKDIVSVASAFGHTVGLKLNGTVVAVGRNEDGEINVGNWKDIIAIAAGSEHTVGLKSDGTVVATGDNTNGQCNVSEWKNIVAISTGDYHTVGLKADGTVVATKVLPTGEVDIDYGQSAVAEWDNIVAISTGTFDTIGLKKDGTVVVAGRIKTYQSEVSRWRNIVAVAAGNAYCVGLKADGTVVAAGNNSEGQCNVKGWKDIVEILSYYHCTYGLKSDGTLVYAGPDLDRNTFTTWSDIKIPE